MILVDTNVWVAALVKEHVHYARSIAFLENQSPERLLTAAHSLAECYSTLTRTNGQYALDRAIAGNLIAGIAARAPVVAMSALQTIDAVRRFSALGTGPRLYDYLIGAVGELYGATTVVTWNVRDFAPLFPAMRVVTPD